MNLAARSATPADVRRRGSSSLDPRAQLAVTAAIAVATASSIAGAALAPPIPDLTNLSSGAVSLTGSWDDGLATAEANIADIWNHVSAVPFPALQQQLANQIGYLQDLIQDPGAFQAVLSQIQENVTAVFGAPATGEIPADPGALFGPFLPAGGATSTLYQSLDNIVRSTGTGLFGPGLLFFTHDGIYQTLGPMLPGLLPALGLDDSDLPLVQQLFDFLGSPMSGVVMGDIGTMLSPALQFNDDITAISEALSGATPDWGTAFQDLLNMPASITNSFLNGYGDVDLLPVLDQLGISLPSLDLGALGIANLTGLAVNLGGLLSPGGSIFDAVGIGADVATPLGPGSFDLAGLAVGPIGSMVELGQAIAAALGWDGSSAPLDILGSLF